MLEENITLLKIKPEEDSEGYDTLTIEEETEVYADVVEPFRDEFYKAARAGYKVSKQFKVVTDEYHGEQRVRQGKQLFKVVRSYPLDRIYSMLVCEEVL